MNDDQIRAEVRQWLAENWGSAMDRAEWNRRVFDAGWSAPSWEPQWGGRGLTDTQSRIVAAEFAEVGARGTGGTARICWPAPHDLGTEEQKQRLIPPSVRSETRWCLLYSEPGAGSIWPACGPGRRDGDDWVVNGQKCGRRSPRLPTTACWWRGPTGMCPKHKGISFFISP